MTTSVEILDEVRNHVALVDVMTPLVEILDEVCVHDVSVERSWSFAVLATGVETLDQVRVEDAFAELRLRRGLVVKRAVEILEEVRVVGVPIYNHLLIGVAGLVEL